MGKIFTVMVVLGALFAGRLSAQQEVLSVGSATIHRDVPMIGQSLHAVHQPNGLQTVACGADTLAYALNKSTGLRVLNMNGATSAQAFGQYYDAPQLMSISKLRFYAYKLNAVGGVTSNIVVEIYNARPDSLPLGAPLRTATVAVDTNFHGGSLAALEKVATFPLPVALSNGYVVVVRNMSSNPVGIVVNNYLVEDGRNEWLASAQFAGIWRHSYDVNVAAVQLNCDLLLDPVVETRLRPSFSTNPGCIGAPGMVSFTNTSSPILSHRMYSVAAFLGQVGHGVVWNFGDGTGDQRQTMGIDTVHYYAAAGGYTVTLKDTLYGWTRSCAADTAITLGQGPEALFAQTNTNLVVQFTDLSLHNPTAWYWSFGDGTTANVRNPVHVYATAGNYQVCHWSISACGSDSICRTVSINCPAPSASFSSSTNNLSVAFVDWSTGGVNAWEWSFGDGAVSNQQNPTHTYLSPGNYLVHLRAYNACGMDSSWYWLNITCAMPTSAFTQTTNNLSVSFANASQGSTAWAWDFGDGDSSTLENPVHTYNADGTYNVCLTSYNNCGGVQSCELLNLSLLAMPSQAASQIQVYPNPAANILHIHAPAPGEDFSHVELLDLMGNRIRQMDLGMNTAAEQMLDVSNIANGSYLLRFQGAAGTVLKHVTVLR